MKKSYYAQVRDIVAPKLEFYTEDLTIHDRRALRGYRAEFIHASRDSGTDLILFDKIDSVKSFEWAVTFALRSSNNLFLHGHNGRVKRITRERAIKICRAAARVTAAKEARARHPDDDQNGLMHRFYERVLPDYLAVLPSH